MLLIYNISIRFYVILIAIAALFNKKAKKWINGRKGTYYEQSGKSVWFHFASLGEFEQGRPVLEAYKTQHADTKIVITFFSPSGYEVRKNTPLADAVYYLPADTAANARKFITAINPSMAVFTKYEYWYHFFNELKEQKVPLYMISAIFRPGQIFFKWYGGVHRKMLSLVTFFFVQDEQSIVLLKDVEIDKALVSGDTRFDRVWENTQHTKLLPLIAAFKNGRPVVIAGSTWPEDEQLLAPLTKVYGNWKFIFAPHEISEPKISRLLASLPAGSAIRYSQIGKDTVLSDYQFLVIDNIGLLSSLYQYGDIAYIGGGFGAGIHNTLEAAAFGLPVVFGPDYDRFKEAKDLIALKAGFSINNADELKTTMAMLMEKDKRELINQTAANYVKEHTGATQIIMNRIQQKKQNDLP